MRATVRLSAAILCVIAPSVALADDAVPTLPGGPFERGTVYLTVSGQGLAEAWDYNGSREELFGVGAGLAYVLRNGLVLFVEPEVDRIVQRSSDAALFAAPVGARLRILRRGRGAVFLELALGPAFASVVVPAGGTRFNYLVRSGAGLTWRASRGLHLVGGLRWTHVSNNSLAGSGRNPDLQALGFYAGMLLVGRN